MQRLTRAVINGFKLRARLLASILISLVAWAIIPADLSSSIRAAVTWDVGGLSYLALTFALMTSCDIDCIRAKAGMEDEARFVFFAVILLAIVSSFHAVFSLIGDAKTLTGAEKAWHIGLAAATVMISWLIMQVIFTLHYAHDYYDASGSDGGDTGGLNFPGDEDPDYWDFFYFTTSIGAASQTSDVSITSKGVRRMVAFQAVLAFVFNTAVVALAINLASQLI